jgi:hypothetical protein
MDIEKYQRRSWKEFIQNKQIRKYKKGCNQKLHPFYILSKS